MTAYEDDLIRQLAEDDPMTMEVLESQLGETTLTPEQIKAIQSRPDYIPPEEISKLKKEFGEEAVRNAMDSMQSDRVTGPKDLECLRQLAAMWSCWV